MRRWIFIAGVLLLAASAPAVAQDTNVPPGNSGLEQYLETVPGAGGDSPPRGRPGAGTRLGAPARRRLEALGVEGEAAASLAEAGSPSDVASGNASSRRKGGKQSLPSTASGAEAALKVAGGQSNPDGMGVALPLVLALTGLAALTGAVLRRRARSQAGDE